MTFDPLDDPLADPLADPLDDPPAPVVPAAPTLPPHVRAIVDRVRAAGGHAAEWTGLGKPMVALSALFGSELQALAREILAHPTEWGVYSSEGQHNVKVVVWGWHQHGDRKVNGAWVSRYELARQER